MGTPCLMIGSLDGLVRVYDLRHYKVSHFWKYHFPVLSLDVSRNSYSMAVGMSEGTLCIRKFSPEQIRSSSKTTLNESLAGKPLTTLTNSRYNREEHGKTSAEELMVTRDRNLNFKTNHFWLKLSRHSDTLKTALSSRSPEVIKAVLEEHINRGTFST